MKDYWVYIVASRTRVIYIGVTSNLEHRIHEHRSGKIPGFTAQYLVRKLVYAERTGDVNAALRREKQLKRWRREKKVALIERANPGWDDLYVPEPRQR